MKTAQKVRVCVMSPYFLYLPASYAIATRCFGLLNAEEYELEEKQAWPHAMQSDDGVLQILSSGAREYENVWFALCDPTLLLKSEAAASFRSLRVIATIVSSSAFWAVNHNSRKCELLSELAQFEKIIAYRAGTTSHAIAKKILKHKATTDPATEIIEVDAGNEQMKFTESGEGTLMISPSVDDIEWLLRSDRNYHVMLEIGKTPEFSNLITTALLVRQEVIQDHPKLVQTLLTGIQLALNSIHEQHLDTLAFAKKSTLYGEYAEHALKRAIESNVIPHSIEVHKDAWFRAARNYYSSELEDVDDSELERKMQKAVEIYKCCIEPVIKLNKDARKEAKRVAQLSQEKRIIPTWLVVTNIVFIVLVVCGILSLVFGFTTEAIILAIAIFVGYISQHIVLQNKLGIGFISLSTFSHWISITLFSVGVDLLVRSLLLGIAPIMVGATFWLGTFRPKLEELAKSNSK